MAAKTKDRLSIVSTISIIAVLAVVLGYWLQHHAANQDVQQPIDIDSGIVFPNRQVIPVFHLIDDQGRPFTNDSLKGHWSLVFFGFTHCPLMCPTTLSELNQVVKQYEGADDASSLQVVFISVDPKRDTETVLRDYVSHFNPSFVGVMGNEQQLFRLIKNFGVFYKTISVGDDYSLSHSGVILVVDPSGFWVAALNTPRSAPVISKDLRYIQQLY